MRKLTLSFVGATVASMAFANPEVSNITSSQDVGSRRVVVNYTLANDPAIITLVVETNSVENGWVSIGDKNLTFVTGEANKVVQPGTRQLVWMPNKAWPNMKISEGNIRVGVKAWALNAPPEIMAVNLKVRNTVNYYSSADAVPGGITSDLYKTDVLVMRNIPAAGVTWTMGSPESEFQHNSDEAAHTVTMSADYYIGVYPVTQRQFELIHSAHARPSTFKLEADYATRPVETIAYSTMVNWCGNLLTAHSGVSFDMPTNEQWEYACRAGTGTSLYNGESVPSRQNDELAVSENLARIGRYRYNGGHVGYAFDQYGVSESQKGNAPADKANCTADHGSAKVGSYEPNAWGLYDMIGNVWELCKEGSAVWRRGGAWNGTVGGCRSACRRTFLETGADPAIGFRVVSPIQ